LLMFSYPILLHSSSFHHFPYYFHSLPSKSTPIGLLWISHD
jgi:hypothetical protein